MGVGLEVCGLGLGLAEMVLRLARITAAAAAAA